MEREILFRGRRLDGGEWVEGHLLPFKAGQINPNRSFILPFASSASVSLGAYTFGGFVEVDPATVGQYTGLKDKNGTKIFEGDIVTGYFDHEKIIGTIVYGSDAQYYIDRSGLYGIYLDNAENWIEVISNKWDNPELLEVMK